MDKEKYLKEKLAEYQEFVVNQVNKNPEHFGDLVERSTWLMGHQLLYIMH